MKWKQFIEKVEALGYCATATVLDNDLVTKVTVMTKSGDRVAEVEDMHAHNYDTMYYWEGSKLYHSETQHSQLVLLVQQMGDTKIQNRGILPSYVPRRKFEIAHETVC